MADALVHVQCAYTSLARLGHVGMIAREGPFLARAAGVIGRAVLLVSYGDGQDERLAETLRPVGWAGSFGCLCNRDGLEPARFQADVPARVVERLRATGGTGCRSVLVMTDQHYGGEVAMQAARALRASGMRVGVVARCGYHWSWTVARDTSPDDPRAVAAAVVEGEVCRDADVVVATTRRIAENLAWRHHLVPEKMAVVPNFVLPSGDAPGMDGRERGMVLYAGRLEAEKRVDLLIRAMAVVGGRLAGARLVVVGDGSRGTELRSLASELGAPVEFRARLAHEDLLREMGRCAAYAQVSRFEGHPKTIIEAMAMGAVCVVTRAPGVDDEIVPGRTGVVCGDSVEDVARSIAGVLEDRESASRMGAAASADVRGRLTLDAVWPRMEGAWRKAMATAGAGVSGAMPPVRWEQGLLNAGPDGAALAFAASIGAYAKRLSPEARRVLLDALSARVGSLAEQLRPGAATPDSRAVRR